MSERSELLLSTVKQLNRELLEKEQKHKEEQQRLQGIIDTLSERLQEKVALLEASADHDTEVLADAKRQVLSAVRSEFEQHVEKLTASNDALHKRSLQLMKQCAELETEVESMSMQRRLDAERMQRQLDAEKERAQMQLEQMRKELTEIHEQQARCECAALRAQLTEQRQQMNKNTGATKEHQRLSQAKIDQLLKENAEMQSQAAVARIRNDAQAKQIEQLKSTIEQLHIDADSARKRRNKERRDYERTVEELRADMQTLINEFDADRLRWEEQRDAMMQTVAEMKQISENAETKATTIEVTPLPTSQCNSCATLLRCARAISVSLRGDE